MGIFTIKLHSLVHKRIQIYGYVYSTPIHPESSRFDVFWPTFMVKLLLDKMHLLMGFMAYCTLPCHISV